MSYDPWRALHTLVDWTLIWGAPASGARAETHWPTQTILIRPGLLQRERRSVLAHELEHVDRGPFPRWATGREEDVVEALAAGRLIAIHDLADALAWSLDPDEVAEDLWVDIPTLMARLRHLDDAERLYLRRRLSHLIEED